jgi:hypothetical protein
MRERGVIGLVTRPWALLEIGRQVLAEEADDLCMSAEAGGNPAKGDVVGKAAQQLKAEHAAVR